MAAEEAVARTLDSDARLAPAEIEGNTRDHIVATREKVGHVHEDHVRLPKSEQIGLVKDDLDQDNNCDEEIAWSILGCAIRRVHIRRVQIRVRRNWLP